MNRFTALYETKNGTITTTRTDNGKYLGSWNIIISESGMVEEWSTRRKCFISCATSLEVFIEMKKIMTKAKRDHLEEMRKLQGYGRNTNHPKAVDQRGMS